MCGVLALLFMAVPALEIFVILQVGGLLGVGPTLAVIAVTAVIGAWLARRQGFTAVRELQESMMTGRRIGDSLLQAALILVAGVLMLTPGFITDVFGFLLLIPPTRQVLARALRRTLERRVARGDVAVFRGGPGVRPGPGRGGKEGDEGERKPPVIDV